MERISVDPLSSGSSDGNSLRINSACGTTDSNAISECDHLRPTIDSCPRPKRRRPNPRTTLQDLPLEAITMILRYLHPTAVDKTIPMSITNIRHLVPLRTLNIHFRDAFDAHVISFDLTDVPSSRLVSVLTTMLPRFHNLAFLSLPIAAFSASLLGPWQYFFKTSQARLQHIMFVNPDSEEQQISMAGSTIPALLANVYYNSLEQVTTNSDAFLTAMTTYPQNLRHLQLHMDRISETRLQSFKGLGSLKMLYRIPMSLERAQLLVSVLQEIRNPYLHIHLRLNKFPSSFYSLLPHIPGLHKVSLFDGVIERNNRGIRELASCPYLEDIQFEWIRQLSGQDIVDLATFMGYRLKRLLIWRCENVTDEGLIAISNMCPNAEVELRFFREQFSQTALAFLGDRVSWGSYVF